MSADVLPFARPEPIAPRCSHCTRFFVRRSKPDDLPAYCDYECGVRGQPKKTRRETRTTD